MAEYKKGKNGATSTANASSGELAFNNSDTNIKNLQGWKFGSGGGFGYYQNDYSSNSNKPRRAGGSVGTAQPSEFTTYSSGSDPSDNRNEYYCGGGGFAEAVPSQGKQKQGYPGLPNTGQGGGGGLRIDGN
jgi:hypothetical protein